MVDSKAMLAAALGLALLASGVPCPQHRANARPNKHTRKAETAKRKARKARKKARKGSQGAQEGPEGQAAMILPPPIIHPPPWKHWERVYIAFAVASALGTVAWLWWTG